MIIGIFHKGSGCGDQLFRYITARTLALDKGLDFGMVAPENFKGKEFLNLDMGKPVNLPYHTEMPSGKVVVDADIALWEEGTIYYNPEINFVEDDTVIDGNFQDERYWGHRLPEIKEWLKTEEMEMPHDLCVINFRGGEFAVFPELFLPQEYWDKAIAEMRKINPKMQFEVHTDDPILAKQFFPDFNIWDNKMITADKRYTHMAFNWQNIRNAKYLILTNSAFGIIPALLNEKAEKIIAPRWWARHNKGYWSLPQNYYKKFQYL